MKSAKISKNVLIVDENVTALTLAVIRCLGIHQEYNLHILSFGNLKIPQFRFSRYIRSCLCVRYIDENDTFSQIKSRAVKVKAQIIFPVNERSFKIISLHMKDCQDYILPPIPDIDTLNLVRNKWLLYNWLYKNNFTSYKPVLPGDVQDNPKIAESLSFPILIKPHWGAGGKGILYAEDMDAFHRRLSEIQNPQDMVIQPIIAGHDIDFSALVNQGKIISYTIQQGIESEKKFIYSKRIEFLKNDRLLEIAACILEKLHYSGIAHLDFRYDILDGTYKLVDFNARFWSSLLGSLNAGINFPFMALNYSDTDKDHNDYNCIRYYVESNPLKILGSKISFKNTELIYDFRDPLPFLTGFIYKGIYHVKKLFNL